MHAASLARKPGPHDACLQSGKNVTEAFEKLFKLTVEHEIEKAQAKASAAGPAKEEGGCCAVQ